MYTRRDAAPRMAGSQWIANMTTLSTPVGHATMRREDLAPTRGSYSPNLFAWMKRHAHFYRGGGHAESVFRVRKGSRYAQMFGEGTLVIGHAFGQYEGDTDFSGVRLMAALCRGARADRVCYLGMMPSLEVVANFWERYLDVGRCAIDPDHQEHFVGGERFSFDGEHRTCLWCGAEHNRVMTPRTVHDESWVARPSTPSSKRV